MDGVIVTSANQPPATQSSGLLGADYVFGPTAAMSSNYLLHPVWLRLAGDVNNWTAFTSTDGVH